MLGKIGEEIKNLAWTIGGTGLVLITLSGTTRTMGIIISVISFGAYIIGAVMGGDE
jgi:hypothetical protein